MVSSGRLVEGLVRNSINVAEYLALLMTCETFVRHYKRLIIYRDIDNTFARAWSSPKSHNDLCGQEIKR